MSDLNTEEGCYNEAEEFLALAYRNDVPTHLQGVAAAKAAALYAKATYLRASWPV